MERTCLESKNNLVKAAFCCVKGTERGELIKSKYDILFIISSVDVWPLFLTDIQEISCDGPPKRTANCKSADHVCSVGIHVP